MIHPALTPQHMARIAAWLEQPEVLSGAVTVLHLDVEPLAPAGVEEPLPPGVRRGQTLRIVATPRRTGRAVALVACLWGRTLDLRGAQHGATT